MKLNKKEEKKMRETTTVTSDCNKSSRHMTMKLIMYPTLNVGVTLDISLCIFYLLFRICFRQRATINFQSVWKLSYAY